MVKQSELSVVQGHSFQFCFDSTDFVLLFGDVDLQFTYRFANHIQLMMYKISQVILVSLYVLVCIAIFCKCVIDDVAY